jgi:uncharacterized protein with von Willebrand factor type A (vWA) domain
VSETAQRTGEDGLAERVVALARGMRDAGVPVSPPEVTDAVAGITAVPLQRREAVRAAVGAALVKQPDHREVFDRLFDVYFPLRRIVQPASPDRRGGDRRAGDEQDDAAELARALREGDEEHMASLARERVDEYAQPQGDANVSVDSYVFRALRGLNLDAVLDAARDEPPEGDGQSLLKSQVSPEDLTQRLDAFRQMLHDEAFSRMLEAAGTEAMASRQQRQAPEDIDFLWAKESDLERIRALLAPLARSLTRRLSHRRRSARRGHLDVRRTIRRSLSAGGALVEPHFRRSSAGKPEIVLLCDISGSMRAFAKFALELTYAVATQFQQVRAFVFVDALDEVTGVLASTGSMATALQRIDDEADVIAVDGQSWYGNCLEQFWSRAGRDLSAGATVLIIGDARANYRSTGSEHLQRVRERVRRVYWLNPEPAEHWDTGDSMVSEYAAVCDRVSEVRNLRQLEKFVAEVL